MRTLISYDSYDDGTVKLWNTGAGALGMTLKDSAMGITSLAFNKNGVLAAGSRDHTVKARDEQFYLFNFIKALYIKLTKTSKYGRNISRFL